MLGNQHFKRIYFDSCANTILTYNSIFQKYFRITRKSVGFWLFLCLWIWKTKECFSELWVNVKFYIIFWTTTEVFFFSFKHAFVTLKQLTNQIIHTISYRILEWVELEHSVLIFLNIYLISICKFLFSNRDGKLK